MIYVNIFPTKVFKDIVKPSRKDSLQQRKQNKQLQPYLCINLLQRVKVSNQTLSLAVTFLGIIVLLLSITISILHSTYFLIWKSFILCSPYVISCCNLQLAQSNKTASWTYFPFIVSKSTSRTRENVKLQIGYQTDRTEMAFKQVMVGLL